MYLDSAEDVRSVHVNLAKFYSQPKSSNLRMVEFHYRQSLVPESDIKVAAVPEEPKVDIESKSPMVETTLHDQLWQLLTVFLRSDDSILAVADIPLSSDSNKVLRDKVDLWLTDKNVA